MNHAIIWTPGVSMDDIQKQVILKALSFYHQDKMTTSNALKIPIKTLEKKIEQYHKDMEDLEERRIEAQSKQDEFTKRARGPRQDPLSGRFMGHHFK